MSAEVFPEPSDTSSEREAEDTESGDDQDLEPYLLINDVRISPGNMHFENAYEGKRFDQKLIIQNCGKHLVLVRLSAPNSSSFKLKPFVEGIHLAPGMKITRSVRYVYRATFGILKGFTKIWVNNDVLTYNFLVTLSMAKLVVEPQVLDFGRIDAVNHACTRTFYVKNLGCKGTHFAIDLGRNPLGMIVKPLSAAVPAKTSVAVKVEIVGSTEGEFIEEFWLKTDPPLRVVVFGVFISPTILVRKFINSLDFTLIDFPPTYYGSTCTQPLLIKNFSASHSMFCVMAEIKGNVMTLEEARKIDDNYKNFIIRPSDGRLAALRGALIQMTYAPIKTPIERNYAACFLKVVRMDCRDIDQEIYEGDDESKLDYPLDEIPSSMLSTLNYFPSEESIGLYGSISLEDSPTDDHFSFEQYISVCLYGEKERAGVKLRPNIFHLNELTLDQSYQRELLVTNKSSKLPITVKYNKLPAIDVKPEIFDLKPKGSLEVFVTIRSFKLGSAIREVTFDLYEKDFPFDRNIIRKVGKASVKIHIETCDVLKKSRLTQCLICHNDLAEKLAPELPYRLDENQITKKIQNDDYFLKYIRNLQKSPPEDEDLEDYTITNYKLLQCENTCLKTRSRNIKSTQFIPLTPKLLHNVKISPKSIKIRKTAPCTSISDFFEIENSNTFPIRIFLKSSKPCIIFDNNSRYIIKSGEKRKIIFSFTTYSSGRYNVSISVLVNDSTLYEVTVTAEVVPKTLKLETDTIEFHENDGTFKFFKLINGLNSVTSFTWDIPHGCFKIYPESGAIREERSILCVVIFTFDPAQPKATECVLTSESGQKKIITISYEPRLHSVVFDLISVDLGLIALNVPIRRKVILRNLKNMSVKYSLTDETIIPGITISPKEGTINGLDSQVFLINICLKAVIEFSTNIIFYINEEAQVISLTGSVDFPHLIFKPANLNFRRIALYGCDTLAFKVKNVSNCQLSVTFPMIDLPEFSVTDKETEAYPHLDQLFLEVDQSKTLFLHYYPKYVSTYSVYFRYIINNILGPAYSTSTPKSFLKANTILYEQMPGVTLKVIPLRSLSTFRINCNATEKFLKIPTLSIDFVYYCEAHYNNITKEEFEIENITNEVTLVCIRIDDLDGIIFSLTPVSTTRIEHHDLSYKITLDPGEKVIFEAEFSPVVLGESVVKLPIFLHHYFNNQIFNFLTLRGTYDRPTITPLVKSCDFEPVPLNFNNTFSLTLQMENHFENCKIGADCDLSFIFTVFHPRDDWTNNGDYLLKASVHFNLTKARCLDTALIIKCTCDATCSVPLTGVAENCLITTHAFSHFLKHETGNEDMLSKSVGYSDTRSWYSICRPRHITSLTNENSTDFPLFPDDVDESDYAVYMRNLQLALENWLYSQGFYMKSYYKIPEGFSDFCKLEKARERKIFGGYRKTKFGELPLLQLVLNFAGNDVRKRLAGSAPETEDETAWLSYTQKTNSKILYYLRGFSIFVPHVRSKYLLNYDQYVLYEKTKRRDQKPMEEKTFYRLSKQCWIDLILQFIKSFVLFRSVDVPIGTEENSETSLTKSKNRTMSDVTGTDVLDVGIYGEREKLLISWLHACYNLEKNNLFDNPPLKELIFLDDDLKDGIVLGVVTAHYCPYVKSEIKNMFTLPSNPEELLHNYCTLVKTWKMLKFSYIINPLQMQNSGMVEMLLLITYLYNVLPNCRPVEKISIEAPLTQSNAASIDLENLGHDLICYQIVFFENHHRFFSVAENTVKIEPKSRRTVKIRYHAKCVRVATTYLLFSGETPGYKYAKSIAVSLEGVTDNSFACMEIPLKVAMYTPCKVTLNLQCPFKIKADYSLSFGYKPTSEERNVFFPWDQVRNLKIIKEFVFSDDIFGFDQEGNCTTTATVCFQHKGHKEIWLYFTNPEVGDWAVKLKAIGTVNDRCFEYIEVELPNNYSNFACRCKGKKSVINNCPMILQVKIPMKNNPLWDARKSMLLYEIKKEEETFWKRRIFTPSGTRILKLILNSETHPMRQTIEDSVTYRVSLDKPKPFATLNKITIDDITSEGYFHLPIHPVDLLHLENCQMQLISEDKSETRFYRLIFRNSPEPLSFNGENSVINYF